MTFPSDLQLLISVELWGGQGFAWDNLKMIPRAMSNLPKPVLQQCQPGESGQGVLSVFSLEGAHAAASLPLEGLLETCRGKNTLLHRYWSFSFSIIPSKVRSLYCNSYEIAFINY